MSRLALNQQERFFGLGLAAEIEKTRSFLVKMQKPIGTITRDYNSESNWFDAPAETSVMEPIDITYRFADPQVGEWKMRLHLYVRQPNGKP